MSRTPASSVFIISMLRWCSIALVALLASALSAQPADPVAATRSALKRAKADAAARKRPALAPRPEYLRRTPVVDVRLSPDGRHLSFVHRGDNGLDVMLENVSSGERTRVVAGSQRAETGWSGDGRRLWVADDHGLAVIEIAGFKSKRILKWDVRRSQELWAIDPRAPRYVIVHEKVVQSGAERHRYLRVDAEGNTAVLLNAPLPLRSALLTSSGALAYTAGFAGPRYETVVRQHTTGKTRELLRCATLEDCRLVGHNERQGTLWMLSPRGDDKLGLRRWRRGRWDTVHRDPRAIADAGEVIWSASHEDWLAVSYHGARRQWYGNQNSTRSLLSSLGKRWPQANLELSATRDAGLWLVRVQQADRALDDYYLFRPDQNRVQRLFAGDIGPKHKAPPGAPMHPVSYRARDGMLVHGYVLLPAGVAPAKAPLIAWLHGGPIARVFDEYNGAMQLLVNRGYAVFVPNFRASTGYGLNYVLAARGDVGKGRVLADVIDGMDFLLAEGIGDRRKQAVMGLSFGGYASLLAISHHPSRFRFAFAGAPPTEYGWIKQWQADNDSEDVRAGGPPLALQFTELGFRYRDPEWREKMRRESPLAALRAVRAPAYIWAGARDDRVPLKSVVFYVGEARRLAKPLMLLIDPDAGHTPGTRLGTEASLYMIELAAHRHFGGGLSSASPELAAFLRRNVRMDGAY